MTYQCPHCAFAAKSAGGLTLHVRRKHEAPPPSVQESAKATDGPSTASRAWPGLGRRLPNVWQHHDGQLEAFLAQLCTDGEAQPGDLVLAQKDVYMVTLAQQNDEWQRILEPLSSKDGGAVLPSKALEWGLQRGFSPAILLAAYRNGGGVRYVVYPSSDGKRAHDYRTGADVAI